MKLIHLLMVMYYLDCHNITVESFSPFFVSVNSSTNSGTFYPDNYNYYYLVFINLDDDRQTSNLYFDVDFDPYDTNYVYTSPIIFLNIIYWSVIGVVIIAIIIKLIQKRSKNTSSYYNYQRQLGESKPYTQQREFKIENENIKGYTDEKSYEQDQPRANYCQFCGSTIERDAIFCHQCGSKLE